MIGILRENNFQDNLLRMPYFSNIKTNKDKSKVGFYWNKSDRMEFYVFDIIKLKNHHFPECCVPKSGIGGFIWLSDSEITIASDEDGDERYAINLYNFRKNKCIRLVKETSLYQIPLDVSPDRKEVLFRSIRRKQMNLYKINLNTKQITELTDHKAPVWFGKWANNGCIYYTREEKINKNDKAIWSTNSKGDDRQRILKLSKESEDIFVDISEDSTLLAFNTTINGIEQSGIFNLVSKEIQIKSKGIFDEYAVKLSRNKKKLLVLRHEGMQQIPIVYDLVNDSARKIKLNGTVFNLDFCLDDKYLLYIRSDSKTPQILCIYNLTENKEEILLSSHPDLRKETFTKAKQIKYKSFDNFLIHSLLYTPKIRPNRKYPAIVVVHGGPMDCATLMFTPEIQFLVNNNFVVLIPNYRGSTGFGKVFRDLIITDWGGGDAKDIVYAKKYLERLKFVDNNRIGIYGESYGGYAVLILLTKFNQVGWGAGIAFSGFSHLKTLYDSSPIHTKMLIASNMGKYRKNKKLWEDRSPMNFADKISSPLLILHGVNDSRISVEQSRQFRDKLLLSSKKEGKDFEYKEIKYMGHGGIGNLEQRQELFELITKFYIEKMS